jgi:hypothetical protein
MEKLAAPPIIALIKKSLIIVILFFVSITNFVYAQSVYPKKVILSEREESAIRDYINFAVSNKYFINGYGIFAINEYLNKDNDKAWLNSFMIDDSYKDDPPLKWANYNDDILLFYDRDYRGVGKRIELSTDENKQLLDSLDNTILDRVYTRPPFRKHFSKVRLAYGNYLKDSNGKEIIRESSKRMCLDFCFDNPLHVIFKKNGEIVKRFQYSER